MQSIFHNEFHSENRSRAVGRNSNQCPFGDAGTYTTKRRQVACYNRFLGLV